MNITNWKEAELKTGDILFQQTHGDGLSQAIRQVTAGYNGAKFDHIGVLMNSLSSKCYVIEALPGGVNYVWLPDFLQKSQVSEFNYKTVLARLKPEYRHLIPKAIEYLFSKIYEPYNPYFDFEKEGFYCSELIYNAFRYANDGLPFFQTQPMTFIQPETGKIHPFWKQYFEKLGVPPPEGKEGINPGLISLSDKIEMIYAFGKIEEFEFVGQM